MARRSFLAAATPVVAAGSTAGGVVVAEAPSAEAATGANVTWRISSSEPAEADRLLAHTRVISPTSGGS